MNLHKDKTLTDKQFDDLMQRSLRNWSRLQQPVPFTRARLIQKAARGEATMSRSQLALTRFQSRFTRAFTFPPMAEYNNWTFSRSLLRSFDKDLLMMHVVG